MTSKSAVLHSVPKILSGTPVFVGTRVPAQSLFDYLLPLIPDVLAALVRIQPGRLEQVGA